MNKNLAQTIENREMFIVRLRQEFIGPSPTVGEEINIKDGPLHFYL